MINTSLFSSDHKTQVGFDATPWFKQASDKDIQQLIDNKFGFCEKANEVAERMAILNPKIADVFIYVHNKSKVEDVVVECYIDPDDANAWISEHRPELLGETA